MLFTLFALMYTFIKYWQEKKMLILEEKNVFIYDLGGTDTYKLWKKPLIESCINI